MFIGAGPFYSNLYAGFIRGKVPNKLDIVPRNATRAGLTPGR